MQFAADYTKIAEAATVLIKHFAPFSATETQGSDGIWRIGYGRRITHGTYVDGITQEQAAEFLTDDIHAHAAALASLITNLDGTTKNEFLAMLSLAYDVGIGQLSPHVDGFCNSKLLRMYNTSNKFMVSAEFKHWDCGDHGSCRRRACETLLFMNRDSIESLSRHFLQSCSLSELQALTA